MRKFFFKNIEYFDKLFLAETELILIHNIKIDVSDNDTL